MDLYWIYLAAAGAATLPLLLGPLGPPVADGPAWFRRRGRALFWLIWALGCGRQLYLAANGFQGFTSSDEHSFARIYTLALGRGEPIYGGFSQGVMAALLWGWYHLAGASLAAARVLTGAMGMLGVLLYRRLVAEEVGEPEANLAGIFLSLSAYFLLFSGVALEVVAVFFFIPGSLLLLRRPGLGFALTAGAFTGLGIFTYPGVILFWAAVALGLVLGARAPALAYVKSRRGGGFAVGFLLVFLAGYLAHRGLRPPPGAFSLKPGFLAGGSQGISLQYWAVLDSVLTCVHELFVGGASWYLDQLPEATFLEQALWIPGGLGVYFAWRSREPRYRALLLTLLILLAVNFGFQSAPGLRRILAILPALYFFAAYGFLRLRSPYRAGALAAVIALLAAHGLAYAPARLAERSPYLGGILRAIPDPVLDQLLAGGPLCLEAASYTQDLDRLSLTSYRALKEKFDGAVPREIRFVERPLSRPDCPRVLLWGKGAPEGFPAEMVYTRLNESLFLVEKKHLTD